jgi:hypothetical protein
VDTDLVEYLRGSRLARQLGESDRLTSSSPSSFAMGIVSFVVLFSLMRMKGFIHLTAFVSSPILIKPKNIENIKSKHSEHHRQHFGGEQRRFERYFVEGGIGRVVEYHKSCRGCRYYDDWRQERVRLSISFGGAGVSFGWVMGEGRLMKNKSHSVPCWLG